MLHDAAQLSQRDLIDIVLLAEFPSFQKHVLDCDIIPVVEAAAKNDTEPYVRASALRCLTLMVKIRLLWEHSLVKLNLMVSFDRPC